MTLSQFSVHKSVFASSDKSLLLCAQQFSQSTLNRVLWNDYCKKERGNFERQPIWSVCKILIISIIICAEMSAFIYTVQFGKSCIGHLWGHYQRHSLLKCNQTRPLPVRLHSWESQKPLISNKCFLDQKWIPAPHPFIQNSSTLAQN